MREKATKIITERIKKQIFEICLELNIQGKWALLFDELKQECNVIKANIHEIDQIIKGNPLPLTDKNLDNWSSGSSSSNSGSGSSPIETFFIIVASPIWIPAAVLALPFILLGETIGNKIDIARYKKNKIPYMNTLAEDIIKKFDTRVIYTGICFKSLQKFMSSLKEICEDIIPNQIKADQELLENISKENRDSQTLVKEYTPIELHCKKTIAELLYVKVKYFPDTPIRILKEKGSIGKGSYAEVHACVAEIGGCKLKCAVKRLTTALQQSDRYLPLSEAENMM